MSGEKTYSQAQTIVRRELKSKKNLKKFCAELEISYGITLKIKNNKTKTQYPHIIRTLLTHMGYKTRIVKQTIFKFS